MQIHLLDATYELFRAHFGRPPRAGIDGEPVGATLGVVESVLSLLREDGVTHLGCATDHVIWSWRNERYGGYKTDEGMPPELLAQFPLVEEALRALGVVVWPMVEFEADDALAAGAARWAERFDVERVNLCSPDKDMAQCVQGDRVVMVDRRRRRVIDEAGVREKFGVSPASMPDWLEPIAEANPFTKVTNASRALYNGLPVGNLAWQSLAWSFGIIIVFSFLSMRKFRQASSR